SMSDLRSWAWASPVARTARTVAVWVTNGILSNMNGFFLVQTLHQRANRGHSAVHWIRADGEARGDLCQVRLHLEARGLIGEDSPCLFREPLRREIALHQFRDNFSFRYQVYHAKEGRLDKALPQEPAYRRNLVESHHGGP